MKTSFKRMAAWVLAMLMLLSCVTALAEDGSIIEFGDVVNVGDQIVPLAVEDSQENDGKIQIEEKGTWPFKYYQATVPIHYYINRRNRSWKMVLWNSSRVMFRTVPQSLPKRCGRTRTTLLNIAPIRSF